MRDNLNIIVLGPQGSGKGNQAKLLVNNFNFIHLEIGRILRKISKKDTVLGKEVASIINKGELVPVSMVAEIIEEELKAVSDDQDIVFDGTPRRLDEIDYLEKKLNKHEREITHVFFISITEEESIKRLQKRKVCLKCGTPFILGKTIEKDEVICPRCGGEVVTRQDENVEAIKKRLALYHKETSPVVNYYDKKGKLIKIDGSQSIDEVFKEIVSYLK